MMSKDLSIPNWVNSRGEIARRERAAQEYSKSIKKHEIKLWTLYILGWVSFFVIGGAFGL